MVDEILNTETFSRRNSVDKEEKEKIEDFYGDENSKIFLISQSVGFSVKNKFVTEETLKKMILLSCQSKP